MLVTDETHSSVKHSLQVVMDVGVVSVPGDERGRLTGANIRAHLADLPEAEIDQIFAVVGTAGTTNSGVIDDLAGIAEVARERDWWFHIDGAYGGAGLAAPSVRGLFAGVEHADSFIVDPHKWLFAPYDCCALVYRDPVLARAAHTQKAGYLDAVTVEGEWNPSDFSVQLTRRARGLPFWFSLAVHGTEAYSEAVEQTLRVARAGQAADRGGRARPAAGGTRPVGADLRADRLAGRGLRPLDGPDAGRRLRLRHPDQACRPGPAPGSPSSTPRPPSRTWR